MRKVNWEVKSVNLPIANSFTAVETQYEYIRIKCKMSTWAHIFTFCVFDAESKTDFTNISAKTKIFSKICLGVDLAPRFYWFMKKKTRAKKSHAAVPFIYILYILHPYIAGEGPHTVSEQLPHVTIDDQNKKYHKWLDLHPLWIRLSTRYKTTCKKKRPFCDHLQDFVELDWHVRKKGLFVIIYKILLSWIGIYEREVDSRGFTSGP